MIEMDLMGAVMKPSDLKVCKSCQNLNWYSNDTCINMECEDEFFTTDTDVVKARIQEDYDFYMGEEGMTEKEVDHILIEV